MKFFSYHSPPFFLVMSPQSPGFSFPFSAISESNKLLNSVISARSFNPLNFFSTSSPRPLFDFSLSLPLAFRFNSNYPFLGFLTENQSPFPSYLTSSFWIFFSPYQFTSVVTRSACFFFSRALEACRKITNLPWPKHPIYSASLVMVS